MLYVGLVIAAVVIAAAYLWHLAGWVDANNGRNGRSWW